MFDRPSSAARVGAGPAATALAVTALAVLLAAAPRAAADAGKVHAGSVSLFTAPPSTLGVPLRVLVDLGCPTLTDPPLDPGPEECTIEVSEPDRKRELPDEVLAAAPIVVEVLGAAAGDETGLSPLAVAVRRVDLLSEPIALPCGDFRLHALLDPAAGDAVSALALRFEESVDAGWLAGPLRLPLRVVLLDGYRRPVAETTTVETLHLFARWSGEPRAGYEKVGPLAVDTDGDGVADRLLPAPADLHPFLEPAVVDPAAPPDDPLRAVAGCVPGKSTCLGVCFAPPPELTH